MCRTGTAQLREGLMKIDNSPARGMRDLLPADVAVRDHVLESISAVYRRFGYQRMATPALAAIGLSETTVRLSDRRFLAALASECGVPEAAQDAFFITLDKLDRIRWDGVRAELLESGFGAAQVTAAEEKIRGLIGVPADKLADALAESVPGLPAAVAEDLAAVADSLARLAAERAVNWQFDPTLVRGMGYYTGQVFEITHPGMNSSVAGGGRYDQLIGRSLGHDVPACGFSIGCERILGLLAR